LGPSPGARSHWRCRCPQGDVRDQAVGQVEPRWVGQGCDRTPVPEGAPPWVP